MGAFLAEKGYDKIPEEIKNRLVNKVGDCLKEDPQKIYSLGEIVDRILKGKFKVYYFLLGVGYESAPFTDEEKLKTLEERGFIKNAKQERKRIVNMFADFIDRLPAAFWHIYLNKYSIPRKRIWTTEEEVISNLKAELKDLLKEKYNSEKWDSFLRLSK